MILKGKKQNTKQKNQPNTRREKEMLYYWTELLASQAAFMDQEGMPSVMAEAENVRVHKAKFARPERVLLQATWKLFREVISHPCLPPLRAGPKIQAPPLPRGEDITDGPRRL